VSGGEAKLASGGAVAPTHNDEPPWAASSGAASIEVPGTSMPVVASNAGRGLNRTIPRWLQQGQVDTPKAPSLAGYSGVYIGGVCGRIYSLYPRVAKWMFGAKMTPRIEGAVSTCLDNFVHVPLLYIPAFYTATGILRGEGSEAAFETLQGSWGETVVSCWGFWIPAQYVIFSKIPAAWRVRAVASGDFVWNVLLSYIAHKPVETVIAVPDVVLSGPTVVSTVADTLVGNIE